MNGKALDEWEFSLGKEKQRVSLKHLKLKNSKGENVEYDGFWAHCTKKAGYCGVVTFGNELFIMLVLTLNFRNQN